MGVQGRQEQGGLLQKATGVGGGGGWRGGESAFIQGVLVRLVQEQRVQGERLRVWKKKKEEKVLRGDVSTEASALLTGEIEEQKQKLCFDFLYFHVLLDLNLPLYHI